MKSVASAALGLLLLTSCVVRSVESPLPYLPRVATPPDGAEQVMLAGLISGKLVVDKGCVKIRRGRSSHFTTVLWYKGTELGRDQKGLFLRETTSGNVVRFGSPAYFGGGDASQEHIEQAYPEVARLCGGPFAFGYPGGPLPAP